MELHLINGFLGSGKTTAIITATKSLIQLGKTVGIVTNDKGQFQVNTDFFESSRIPTRQVTGGCFRCSFDEFEERIKPAFNQMIKLLLAALQKKEGMVGHIKLFVSYPEEGTKISFTTANFLEKSFSSNWARFIPEITVNSLSIMLNARVAMAADKFSEIVENVIH